MSSSQAPVGSGELKKDGLDPDVLRFESFIKSTIYTMRPIQAIVALIGGGILLTGSLGDFDMRGRTSVDYEPSSTPQINTVGLRFYNIPEFQFVFAVAALVFANFFVSFFDCLTRCFYCCAPREALSRRLRAEDHARVEHILQQGRVFLDVILVVLTFSAGFAGIAACTREYGVGDGRHKLCYDTNLGWVASIAMFIDCGLLVVSGILEFARWRTQHILSARLAVRELINTSADEQEAANEEQRTERSGSLRHSVNADEEIKKVEKEGGGDIGRVTTQHNLALYESPQGFFQASPTVAKFFSFLFRFVEMVFAAAILALVFSTNVEFTKTAADAPIIGSYDVPEFQFLLGVAGVSAVVALIGLTINIYKAIARPDRRDINSVEHWTKPLRFTLDIFMVVLTLAAASAGIQRCSQHDYVGRQPPPTPPLPQLPPTRSRFCEKTPEWENACYICFALAATFIGSSILSWTSWLRQRAGETKIRRDRLIRQRSAMSLLSMPGGPLAVKSSQEFNGLVKVLTMSNIHGLTEVYFDEHVDHKFAARMLRIRILQGALAAAGCIVLLAEPSASYHDFYKFYWYEFTEFQFAMAVCALVVGYALVWLVGRVYTVFFDNVDSAQRLPAERTVAPFDVFCQFAMFALSGAGITLCWIRCTVVLFHDNSVCESTPDSVGFRGIVVAMIGVCFISLFGVYVSFKRWENFRATEEVAIVREAATRIQAKLGYQLTDDVVDDDDDEEQPDEGARGNGGAAPAGIELANQRAAQADDVYVRA